MKTGSRGRISTFRLSVFPFLLEIMSSKREEERNEKVIRGLLKLPPNRRCINCNGLGPQYVCTNFWTFVCTACSGIHREFTHRVKSVSMAKFTSQEVEALQNGGNQRARELFLKDWDMQSMKLPDSSYPDRIREFIKTVYVEKKYAVGTSSDKPPIDPQGRKSHEEHRRASSYHSFSQSPPYEHQYEDRRYGKPKIMLSRKPGSDHGHYEGNISSIVSPGRNREHVYEDRFTNESSSSRISDYSISSAGDPFKSGGQSPSMHSNPSSQQKSASLSSFGSFDSNTVYPKSTKFCALSDVMFEPEHASIIQRPNNSTIVSQKTSVPQNAAINDIFGLQFSQPQDMKTSVDLFSDFNNQPSCTSPSGNKPSLVPISGNEGWAMFDFVHHVEPDPEAKDLPSVISPGIEESVGISDGFSSKKDTSQLFTAQDTAAHGKLAPTTDQWHTGFSGIQNAPDSTTPVWNAFDDSFEKNSQALNANPLQGHVLVNGPGPSIFGFQHTDVGHVAIPKARSTQEWKSTNPFELSYDLDAGASNMFHMSSLQAALPKPQLPNAFLEGLSEPWFQQNSASTFSPSIPHQVASPYVGGQVPSSHLPNIPSQGSAASGNPFA